jgi:hypothetical protein
MKGLPPFRVTSLRITGAAYTAHTLRATIDGVEKVVTSRITPFGEGEPEKILRDYLSPPAPSRVWDHNPSILKSRARGQTAGVYAMNEADDE